MHCNITLENILIDNKGIIKIDNFDDADYKHNIHKCKGTLDYMAPE